MKKYIYLFYYSGKLKLLDVPSSYKTHIEVQAIPNQ